MIVEETAIPAVKLIVPERIGDQRGFFSETWNERALKNAGIDARFVQDNHARSTVKGTVRGLHFQIAPAGQDKLIRCTKGAIFDVAVDIRRGSPTFGRHVSVVLSEQNWAQLWVPKGFAHGYATLEEDTEVQYKVTDYYAPAQERGLLWNDPALSIAWPVDSVAAIVSAKDRELPRLADFAAECD